MKRLRQFFAGMLFGQSQVRREAAQLERPPFQLSMTSTEGLLSLFLQRAITLLVPARLKSLLSTAAFGDIQFNSDEQHYVSISIAMDLAQTLYPRHGSVGPDDAEGAVKNVVRLRVLDLVPKLEYLPAVLLVHTAQPGFNQARLSSRETVKL